MNTKKYKSKKYSYKGYKIKETIDGLFDIFKPDCDPNEPVFEELSSIDGVKEWINSDLTLDECDGGMMGGDAAFGSGGGSATFDAPAFGKASDSIIKKKPYTLSVQEIKENIIRPIVEKYLSNYLI